MVQKLNENDIFFVELGSIKPNPTLDQVNEGICAARSFGCDSLLAVGGGSVIDLAKVVSAGIINPEHSWHGVAQWSLIE